MECIYHPELNESSSLVDITGDEAKHLFVLRLKPGDSVFITNGSGLCCESEIVFSAKKEYKLQVIKLLPSHGELPQRLALALGIMDNRDRFEFALEKAIELGITDFYPLQTKFSKMVAVKPERLLAKSIAAIKQCKRAALPIIHNPITLKELLNNTLYQKIVLADQNGITPCYIQSSNTPLNPLSRGETLSYPLSRGVSRRDGVCFSYNRISSEVNQIDNAILALVGPEGGFSDEEISLIKEDERAVCWRLGDRRLRAETASTAIISLISINIENPNNISDC